MAISLVRTYDTEGEWAGEFWTHHVLDVDGEEVEVITAPEVVKDRGEGFDSLEWEGAEEWTGDLDTESDKAEFAQRYPDIFEFLVKEEIVEPL